MKRISLLTQFSGPKFDKKRQKNKYYFQVPTLARLQTGGKKVYGLGASWERKMQDDKNLVIEYFV